MIASAYDPDLSRFTERLAAVSDLASQYGLRAVLEFFPWTVVPDLSAALRIVEAAERPALGILVDTLHFNRSASRLDDLDRVSAIASALRPRSRRARAGELHDRRAAARRPRGAPAARRGRHRYQAHTRSYASGHPGGAGGADDGHGRRRKEKRRLRFACVRRRSGCSRPERLRPRYLRKFVRASSTISSPRPLRIAFSI